jgi:hypothetical protein
VQLGWGGVTIFALAAVAGFKRAGAAAITPGGEAWPLAVLTVFALRNLTESALMQQNTLTWTLFVICTAPVLYRGSAGTSPIALSEAGVAPRSADGTSMPVGGARRRMLGRARLR